MIYDPLFILSLIGMFACLALWVRNSIKESDDFAFIIKNLSTISTAFGLLMLYSIFINAGDLGIVLLIGSIVSLIVLLLGIYLKNKTIVSSSRGYFIPIFLIFVLRTFLYEPYQIPSGSMMPGLKVGDFVLVNKYSYGLKINRTNKSFIKFNEPDYGEVVVFVPPYNPVPYVKRLIGKPGDTIRIINKQVYVNNKPLEKTLISSSNEFITKRILDTTGQIKKVQQEAKVDIFSEKNINNSYMTRNIKGSNIQYPQEWTVPNGFYFVMGDNRDNSNDSTKDVGFVPRDHFFGKAEYLWMSWECWTCIPNFSRAGKIN